MWDVVSIGGVTVDILVGSDGFKVQKNRKTKTGTTLSIDHNSKNEVDKSLICSGGGATNTSTSFARLGLKAGCVGLMGDDELSGFVENDLKKEGVNNLIKKEKKAKKQTTEE